MGDLCRNANQLFIALDQGKDDRVIDLCRKNEEGGLSVCGIHNSTVLHLAIINPKLFGLANTLLDDLLGRNNENQEGLQKLLHCVDAWGNSLLHCAAISNNVVVAERFYNIAPDMLFIRNKWGETAFFHACRYVNFEIFEYLADKLEKFRQKNATFDMQLFFKRKDSMNVLRVSIVMRAFDIATLVAKRYPDLCKERPSDEMTALQVLASSPTVFRNKLHLGFFDRIIYTCVSACTNHVVNIENKGFINTKINKMKRLKKDHKLVSKLTKILIENEDSWKSTYAPQCADTIDILPNKKQAKDDNDDDDDDNSTEKKIMELKHETALQMAVKNGITEIVEQMLETYPQAVEQYNKEKQNLLHIAIKYRQIEIYDLLQEKYASYCNWLVRDIDDDGNTILHMVGSKNEKDIMDNDTNHVKQLSEGLKLLTRLKEQCPSVLSNHINNDMMTADKMFATNNKELHKKAKEWLVRTAEHCTVVIVLIATVAFAAAYTVPGGPNQETGAPVLLWNPFFLVFTMTDVLSLAFALTAVVLFLLILTSSFKLKQFQRSLPTKLFLGFTFVFLSVTMMMVSFASTIILTIHKNQQQWTKIAVYSATFFPIAIFVFSFIPLYFDLADVFKNRFVIKIGNLLLSSHRGLSSRFACSSSCFDFSHYLLLKSSIFSICDRSLSSIPKSISCIFILIYFQY